MTLEPIEPQIGGTMTSPAPAPSPSVRPPITSPHPPHRLRQVGAVSPKFIGVGVLGAGRCWGLQRWGALGRHHPHCPVCSPCLVPLTARGWQPCRGLGAGCGVDAGAAPRRPGLEAEGEGARVSGLLVPAAAPQRAGGTHHGAGGGRGHTGLRHLWGRDRMGARLVPAHSQGPRGGSGVLPARPPTGQPHRTPEGPGPGHPEVTLAWPQPHSGPSPIADLLELAGLVVLSSLQEVEQDDVAQHRALGGAALGWGAQSPSGGCHPSGAENGHNSPRRWR